MTETQRRVWAQMLLGGTDGKPNGEDEGGQLSIATDWKQTSHHSDAREDWFYEAQEWSGKNTSFRSSEIAASSYQKI